MKGSVLKPKSVPTRLKKDLILEALCELRFVPTTDSFAQLFPGIFFSHFGDRFREIEQLPISQLPPEVVNSDPNFAYASQIRMIGGSYAVQAGSRSLSIICMRPYTGWSEFEPVILETVELLRKTGLVSKVERFSIKYTDLIPRELSPSLEWLNLDISLAESKLTSEPVNLRVELREKGVLHIVQVATFANVTLRSKESLEGLWVDVDTIVDSPPESFWEEFPSRLRAAHYESKRQFFSLLAESTLEKLEPEYE